MTAILYNILALCDGTGGMEPDSGIDVFLSGAQYVCIWKYCGRKAAGSLSSRHCGLDRRRDIYYWDMIQIKEREEQ